MEARGFTMIKLTAHNCPVTPLHEPGRGLLLESITVEIESNFKVDTWILREKTR
jgi:hypothetical protein